MSTATCEGIVFIARLSLSAPKSAASGLSLIWTVSAPFLVAVLLVLRLIQRDAVKLNVQVGRQLNEPLKLFPELSHRSIVVARAL